MTPFSCVERIFSSFRTSSCRHYRSTTTTACPSWALHSRLIKAKGDRSDAALMSAIPMSSFRSIYFNDWAATMAPYCAIEIVDHDEKGKAAVARRPIQCGEPLLIEDALILSMPIRAVTTRTQKKVNVPSTGLAESSFCVACLDEIPVQAEGTDTVQLHYALPSECLHSDSIDLLIGSMLKNAPFTRPWDSRHRTKLSGSKSITQVTGKFSFCSESCRTRYGAWVPYFMATSATTEACNVDTVQKNIAPGLFFFDELWQLRGVNYTDTIFFATQILFCVVQRARTMWLANTQPVEKESCASIPSASEGQRAARASMPLYHTLSSCFATHSTNSSPLEPSRLTSASSYDTCLAAAWGPFSVFYQEPLSCFHFSYITHQESWRKHWSHVAYDTYQRRQRKHNRLERYMRCPDSDEWVLEAQKTSIRCPRTLLQDIQTLVHHQCALFVEDLKPSTETMQLRAERRFISVNLISHLLGLILLNGQGIRYTNPTDSVGPTSQKRDGVSSMKHGNNHEEGAMALYPLGSCFNHSCAPNARMTCILLPPTQFNSVQHLSSLPEKERSLTPRTLLVEATRDVAQGEECTISYLDLNTTAYPPEEVQTGNWVDVSSFRTLDCEDRRWQLFDHYLFSCRCIRCLRERL